MCGLLVSLRYEQEAILAFRELHTLISLKDCAPIMLRLAWHEAATYDAQTDTGGPNGCIRFGLAYSHGANNGLKYAIKICEIVKSKHPLITYADLYQLAGVAAVIVAGGPIIPFYPGRKDATLTPMYGRLLPAPTGDAAHLRKVFYRMGFSDRDIVVLSGGHTLGRAHQERSGFEGPWTREPLRFDNSYFVELLKGETEGLLKLPSDVALLSDSDFRTLVEFYAKNADAFIRDYALSHQKFSELGFTPNSEDIMRYRKKTITKTKTKTNNWWWVGGTVAAAVVVVVLLSLN